MNVNDKSVVGAGIVGAGIGAIAGKKILNSKLKTVFSEGFLNAKNVDEYVSSRLEANMENVHKLKRSKWGKEFAKIAEKAKADYPKLLQKLKSCNIKYIGGFAAIGLAVGLGIQALINHSANKKEA